MELMEQYNVAQPKAAPRGILPTLPPRQVQQLLAAPRAITPTVTIEGRPVKRLTQAEQEERRRLGLCYNCDEKYGRGHNQVCKRLFLLDSVEEDDAVDAERGDDT